jgi:PAS domain S-box-containing protein
MGPAKIECMNEQLNKVIRLLDRLQSQSEHVSQDELRECANLATAMEELRVAEEQLVEQNQALSELFLEVESQRTRYCDLFDLAPDGYIVTDQNGTILEANRAMCDMLDANIAALVNKPLATLFPVEDGRAFGDFFLNVRSAASPADCPPVWQKEMSMQMKTITPVMARCSVSSPPGRTEKIIRWIFRDLTDQKQTEADIKRANQSLETSVHDRTVLLEEKISELESFHDVVVGRELRLVELEEEVERLRQRLAKYEPARY